MPFAAEEHLYSMHSETFTGSMHNATRSHDPRFVMEVFGK